MITVVAGAPPVIKNSMYTAALLMELVSCVNNRSAPSQIPDLGCIYRLFCTQMCSDHTPCCIWAAGASGRAFGLRDRGWIGLTFLALAAVDMHTGLPCPSILIMVNCYGVNHLDIWPNDL